MLIFRPLKNKVKYERTIEKEVKKFIDKSLYRGVLSLIKRRFQEKFNSVNKLVDDILSGKIQYTDTGFIGKFSASTSSELKKLGAKFNPRKKSWIIPQGDLPFEIVQSVSASVQMFKNVQTEVIDFLDNLRIGEDIEAFNLDSEYSKILQDANKGFRDIVKKISIEPHIDIDTYAVISERYTNNMKRYIKEWAEDNIIELRDKVYKNTFAGYRADNLVKIIRKNYSVGLNKAKFLARQETALLMSEFRQERFKSVGVTRYKWSTAKDNRVRDMHKHLDGKIYSWDNPPISGTKGERQHPGEPYGCRCVAIPVLEQEVNL